MTDQGRRTGPPPSKPGPTPGISPADFQGLKMKVLDLERQLQEALAERNQWNQVLRRWQDAGRHVKFTLQGGVEIGGKISWIDRYTIGIFVNSFDGAEPTIIHKGAIATVSV